MRSALRAVGVGTMIRRADCYAGFPVMEFGRLTMQWAPLTSTGRGTTAPGGTCIITKSGLGQRRGIRDKDTKNDKNLAFYRQRNPRLGGRVWVPRED